jgi:hypothetical protein
MNTQETLIDLGDAMEETRDRQPGNQQDDLVGIGYKEPEL